MDSVTQILLGASVAELVIGRDIGRRAAVYGAMLGTLPDLDVIINYGGPVENFTYHRGFSHSVFVLTAISPLIGWAFYKLMGRASLKRWIAAVWLVLITHPLLDAFTVYGTQLFWPFTDYPVSGSTVFIIDPAYTIWLAMGVLAVVTLNRSQWTGYRLNALGLAVATGYLGWAAAAKAHVTSIAEQSLQQQGIRYEKLLSTPGPFNTLLWRFVAVQDGHYLEGYYSLLDASRDIHFDRYPNRTQLLEPITSSWQVRRLKWFTHGFYKVRKAGNAVVMSDLRMGVEGAYSFNFKVGEVNGDGSMEATNQRMPVGRDMRRLPLVWQRIWDETVSLAP
jgi:inner membrane protein